MRKTLFTLLAVSAAGLAVASFSSNEANNTELAGCGGGCGGGGCGKRRSVAVINPTESYVLASCSGGRCGNGRKRQVAHATPQRQEAVAGCGCSRGRGKAMA